MKREAEGHEFVVLWDAQSSLVFPETRLRSVEFCVQEGLLSRATAYDLDRAVYDREDGDKCGYSARMHSLLYNMLIHPALRNLGATDPCLLAGMDAAQMRRGTVLESIERDEEIRRVQFESMLQETYDRLSADAPATISCRKCKGSNLEFSQKQTRSADEAMTVFTTCRDCGQKWKM